MKNTEKLYKIRYGTEQDDYFTRYLKEEEIIDGYLSEGKAFELIFDSMILCNDYLKYHYNNIDYLVNSYNEEEDDYREEYQLFIVDLVFDEDITIKAVEKMGNTLYFDNDLNLYIMGVCDLGTSRRIVPTDIEVYEVTE